MIGLVVKKKLGKVATVEVEKVVEHPFYKKRVRRRKKYLVHDTLGVKEGDKVVIESAKPISKRKRFSIVEVLK